MRRIIPGTERAAGKARVNLTLDRAIVAEARGLTGNLSDTVETLLADYVHTARARREERERLIDEHVAWSNDVIARHGGWADEYLSAEPSDG